jgi:pimeloyl-ACP methyl ester carboxylesterase
MRACKRSRPSWPRRPRVLPLADLSMGGLIAYELIRQAADRLTRLAFLDAGARAEAPERRAARLRLIALAERVGGGQGATGITAAAHPHGSAAGQAGGGCGSANGKRYGCCRLQAAASGHHGSARQPAPLVDDEGPDLVLVGREDALTPPSLVQKIADRIPGARLEIIPDCGHLSPWNSRRPSIGRCGHGLTQVRTGRGDGGARRERGRLAGLPCSFAASLAATAAC